MNRVWLTGSLQRDPEPNVLNSGDNVCRLHLLVRRNRADFDMHIINAFGPLARACDRLTKGSRIAVEGALRSKEYTKQDGIRIRFVEVKAYKIEFLDEDVDEDFNDSDVYEVSI